MMDNLYNTDYSLWVQQQKEYLKNRQFDRLDLENLIEEVEDMGKHEPRSMESHLVILLIHLLKYQYQTYVINPNLYESVEFRSWYESMDNARRELRKLLRGSPSLKAKVSNIMLDAYQDAKAEAVKQMNRYIKQEHLKLTGSSFPVDCPWTFDEIMEEDWLPGQPVQAQE
ncbi:MAG: DUF29 domain-containing protein [Endozoicomonas sp.]|uniref:DUF29 domain-containing protein n=1 Tax=Endozoicomonas sp. TaxID=1892382 RepID=UPI003D9BB3DB